MAGCVPHRLEAGESNSNNNGLNADEMVTTGRNAFLLLGVEPELDCISSAQALTQMINADFVVSMTSFVTDSMKTYADVLLPVTPFTETSGTFVNIEGVWQSFNGSVTPYAESRPAWKVLRVLGNLFNVDGFDYLSSEDVRDELKAKVDAAKDVDVVWQCPKSLPVSTDSISRIAYTPIYSVDAMVRRAAALQKTQDAVLAAIYINSKTANSTSLTDDDNAIAIQNELRVVLPVVIDDGIPDNCVLIPIGLEATNGLSQITGSIEIIKA